jgi:hypothetical protein
VTYSLAMQAFSTHKRCMSACQRVRFARLSAISPRQEANVAASDLESAWLTLGTSLAAPLLCAAPAFAQEGEFGLLEGRTLSLIHPAVMITLLCSTLYAGWLGLQVCSTI